MDGGAADGDGVLWHAMWFAVVAVVWGSTNPLLKRGGAGLEKVQHPGNRVVQLLAELKFLALNWRYMLPFLVNQSGSVVYYLTIASADISLAVPITNSLTFLVTMLVGRWMGERAGSHLTYVGIVLVVCGVTLCVVAKVSQ